MDMSVPLRPRYRLTEVGVIPEDWAVACVGDSFDVCNQLRFPISQSVRESMVGPYPYYGPTNVQGWINEYRAEGEYALIGEDGDHFLKWRTQAMTLLVRGKFNVNNHAHLIQGSKNLTEWFYWFFAYRDITTYLTRQGASRYKLKKATLLQIPCALPTLPEQRAIAAALSDVDALLAKQGQLIAKKRDLKQAAMQQLLTGQTRLPGFSGEWEVKRLGDLTNITRGASPRPIDSPIWFDESSSIGWVRISDVTKSEIFLRETTQHLSPLGIKSSRPVNRGTLIMSICATVGRPVITEIDTCIHDGFVVFDVLRIDQRFLYYALKFIENDWSKHGQTGSQMNLNTGLINRTVVSVPKSNEEQTAIATVLSDMDAELAALEARRDKTRALKQGMMQELLTGKTRLI